ncbi:MAG: hypothetical protein M1824_002439 [Vezdaea acicularis]|nr:MAG: hypothetical protein M1824_002439 [Vezdaea acicularis]
MDWLTSRTRRRVSVGGNNQSAPTPRQQSPQSQQRRLSKPLTNSSSSDLLSAIAASSGPSSNEITTRFRTQSESEAVPVNGGSYRRSRSDLRLRLKEHLFSFRSDPRNECAVDEEEDDDDQGIMMHQMRSGNDRVSRSSSGISRLASAHGSSTLLSSLPGSRLSLVAEGTISVPTEYRDTFDELKEDRNMPPKRRRSWVTPGIATRGGLANPYRKPPPPKALQSQEDHDYYYNPAFPEFSPLAQLASLDSFCPETSTDELDYITPLAGLRKGTLRITNGTASPAPSMDTLRSLPRLSRQDKHEEEYFSASEGYRSDEENSPKQTDAQKRSNSSELLAQRISKVFYEEVSRISRPPISVDTQLAGQGPSTQSPLKYESMPSRSAPTIDNLHIRASTPENINSFSDFRFLSTPDKASSIAQEYREELSLTPFSYMESPEISPIQSVQQSPRLEATSKVTEFEDHLFDDDDEGVVTDSDQWGSIRSGAREDALRILGGEMIPSSRQRESGLAPSLVYPRVSSAYSEGQSEDGLTASSLSKADSGYSSNTSVRSFKRERRFSSQTDSGMGSSPIKLSMFPTETIEEVPSPPRRSPPKVPPLPARSPPVAPPEPFREVPPIPSPIIDQRPWSEEPLALPVAITKELPESPEAPMKKPGSVANARKRLRKQRPHSQPPPLPVNRITVQAYREISQQHIPPVPSEVAARHAARHKAFPTLDHTYPSLEHTNTAKSTSSSVLSLIKSVPIRFPSPANTSNTAAPCVKARRQSTPVSSANHPTPVRDYGNVASHTPDRRSSWQRNSGTITSFPFASSGTITDFGTVAESLGASPYDAALSAAGHAARRNSGSSFTSVSPYQMGFSTPRSRSMIGMDSEAAVEFARERSRDFGRSTGRDSTRPRSVQFRFSDERRGSIEGMVRPSTPPLGRVGRPRSVYFETPPPPVPALPNLLQTTAEDETEETELERNTRMNRFVLPPPSEKPSSRLLSLKQGSEALSREVSISWAQHKAAWRERRKSAGQTAAVRRGSGHPVIDALPGRVDQGLDFRYEEHFGIGGTEWIRA